MSELTIESSEIEPETAEKCFERLMRDAKSPKFKTALERVRKACDTIESMGGVLNVNRISEYCVNHFGGPAPSTLHNSNDHKVYIGLRRQEAEAKQAPVKKSTPPKSKYPVDGLDQLTKNYIDQLLERNKLLESTNTWQRKVLENKTRAEPLKLGQAITTGPDQGMALQVLEGSAADGLPSPALSPALRDAIQSATQALETLEAKVDYLTVDVRKDGRKRLLWESPANTEVLIRASQWQALIDALEASGD